MPTDNLVDELPGFDTPIAVLRACHERILAQCDVLERLLAHLDDNSADEEARKAATGVVRYFSTAGKLHHRDEEEDLFPRINRQSLKIAELVHTLKKEHVALDALWADIEPILKKLPAEGVDYAFRKAVTDFCTLMREHVQRENMELLPLASSSLSQLELEEVGQAMAERRGVRLQEM